MCSATDNPLVAEISFVEPKPNDLFENMKEVMSIKMI